tara:strand:- start:245 stop:973 length:729 start_codon:yes stop_codon:yes gene_type:complete
MPAVTHSNSPFASNVFVNGGPTLGGAIASALGIEDTVGISDAQADAILAGQADLLAIGEDPETYEALEQFGGGTEDGTSPITGETGAMAAPGSDAAIGADALEDQEIERPTSEWVIALPGVNTRVRPEAWDMMVAFAKSVGRPVTLNSAYRSPEYNRKVGGATKSMHTQRKAMDVQWGTTNIQARLDMIQKAVDAGFTGIGCYDNFMHVDIGSKRHWGPNGSYTGQFAQYKPVLRANGFANA